MGSKTNMYAVLIGNDYTPKTPFNEAVFNVQNAEAARKRGNLYIRQWNLTDERILRIRLMSEEEYQERCNNKESYMAGGYKKYLETNQ